MAISVMMLELHFVNASQQMDVTEAMPRALPELREGRDGRRAKARVSFQKASWKMALELGLEQFHVWSREAIEANGDGTGRSSGASTLSFRFGEKATRGGRTQPRPVMGSGQQNPGQVSWGQVCSNRTTSINLISSGKERLEKEPQVSPLPLLPRCLPEGIASPDPPYPVCLFCL